METDNVQRNWKALAEAAKARREELGLSQGALVDRRGPSRETVRQLEIGDRDNYREVTFTQLDNALEWPAGTTEAVLDDKMTPDEALTAPRRPNLAGVANYVEPVRRRVDRLTWKVDDLAAEFGVSPKAIYQAIDEQRLFAVKVGRSYLIPQWSVDQLLGKAAACHRHPGSCRGAAEPERTGTW